MPTYVTDEDGASSSAFTTKCLEHLASVTAKKCVAPNCNLNKEIIFIRSN